METGRFNVQKIKYEDNKDILCTFKELKSAGFL